MFSPPSWEWKHPDGTFGNRFDDPGLEYGIPEAERFRIIYCATTPVGAFAETLLQHRPPTKRQLEAFMAVPEGDLEAPATEDESLTGAVDPDYRDRSLVTRDWRERRQIGHAFLINQLPFFDTANSDNLAYLDRELTAVKRKLGIWRIDLTAVTSGSRKLTQEIARHVYEITDPSGDRIFSGIRFVSHWGADLECWAVYDEHLQHSPGPSQPIDPDHPALLEVAEMYHLTIEGVRDGQYLRPGLS